MKVYTDIRNALPYDSEGNEVDFVGKPTMHIVDDARFIVFENEAEYDAYMQQHYPTQNTDTNEQQV